MDNIVSPFGAWQTSPHNLDDFHQPNKDFLKDKNFLKNVVVVESDPLRDLLFSPDLPCQPHSDVWLLKNVNRIDSMSPSALAEIIRTRFESKPVRDLYQGLSDDELFTTIKSRHIQSLSELKSYLDFLEGTESEVADRIKSEYESLTTPQQEQLKQQVAPQEAS